MSMPRRPEIFDLAIREAVARRLAPMCWRWHRIAYCEGGGRIKPRWDEATWFDSLTRVLWRDTGRNIAVKLCAIHGLAGMNDDLVGILDQTAAMLEEETDKAVRQWVRTGAITPKLAIGTRVAKGRITDCDPDHARYWLLYDDPRVTYLDPRGAPVACEILERQLALAEPPLMTDVQPATCPES